MKLLVALAVSFALPAAAPATERRLTPAEIQAVLDEAAARREAADRAVDATRAGPDVHGEVGVEIGTGGYRSVFGTGVVGLGDHATAILSVESTRSDARRRVNY